MIVSVLGVFNRAIDCSLLRIIHTKLFTDTKDFFDRMNRNKISCDSVRNIPIRDSHIDFTKPMASFTVQNISLAAHSFAR
jgi:hypothetical protein